MPPDALLPILPDSVPGLSGIARMAAEAPALEERHQADFLALTARSILSRCKSSRVPFVWQINPYRGCEFGCQYCYARYTHEFMELRQPLDFERHIFVKQQAAALLRRELRQVKPEEEIAIGSATDPYQPAERRFGVTRSLLEVFAEARGLRLNLITKGDLIVRDIDLLQRIADRNCLTLRVTITTTDVALARLLEPRAPRPDLRFEAVRRLAEAGLRVGVNCSPALPGITDGEESLRQVMAATARAGARFLNSELVFLQPCAQAQFFPFLEREFPHLVAAYRRRFAHSAYISETDRQRHRQTVQRLRLRHGLTSSPLPWRPAESEAQLALFPPV